MEARLSDRSRCNVTLRTGGEDLLANRCDGSVPEEVVAAITRAIERFGRLDCAFGNVGVENKSASVDKFALAE
jgi:NAD(P)-dependent dehydrogenase (short-subunit alcohol dehydrogenase family)